MIDENSIYFIQEFIPTNEPIDVHKISGDAPAAEFLKAKQDLSWVGKESQIRLRVISGKHMKTFVDMVLNAKAKL